MLGLTLVSSVSEWVRQGVVAFGAAKMRQSMKLDIFSMQILKLKTTLSEFLKSRQRTSLD
jgi:hypothetical protein